MSKKLLLGLLLGLLVVGSLSLFGCSSATQVSATLGRITGTIVAADGTSPIGGASVYLKTDSTKSTTTSYDGSFTLEGSWIITGTYTLVATKGGFTLEFSVTVASSEATTNVGTKEVDPTDPTVTVIVPDLAVIKGSWDYIENIITELGYTYTTITVSDLDNYAFISTFEAIFIDCGTTYGSLTASRETNLRNFVEVAGGSLYASDWAAEYVERLWPTAINFYGTVDPTTYESTATAKVGTGSQTVEATVVDTTLRDYVLGKSTMSIFYDLSSWVVISSEGTGTDVLLRGTFNTYASGINDLQTERSNIRAAGLAASTLSLANKPLAVKFQPAGSTKGTVIYTTFHNEAQEEFVTNDVKNVLKDFIFTLN
ncbi:hypothetical protein A2311_03500 [candidate division WOR-1 bacterium RIFOXYB2_FULL_48_7]|uniref:Carboxypeptidase regulatory-like domain-containing protein n=1 Tax=candidate division WOR-1 bacterium RIFOXYB2_FULL_48_7 TaxID=1802583 RepID=A0A1F4TSG7_UNCSA|nr:MAG: hypothetical protein A2311_03500 [candidate division WOR-1 bacterium RIFOXYB2_FULL_48_7]